MTASLTGCVLMASLVGGALITGGASAAVVAGEAAPSQALLDLMAKGKAETDLGHYDVAIGIFTQVSDAPDAPPALRAEALVRLGVARRGAGDAEGAIEAFERASGAPGIDRDTKALLLQAVGGVLPGADRWAKVWARVSFVVDHSEPQRPALRAAWPDVPETNRVYDGHPISLDFEHGNLQDVFRLFADITGFNVVVSPGVRGEVTIATVNEPWDRVLERMLAANGLAYRAEDNVLLVAQPQRLPPQRLFSGQRIDLDFNQRDLVEGLAEIAAAGGAHVVVDPAVRGKMTLVLRQVRWDQAFDTVVSVNGLDWTREGATLKVSLRR